MRTLAADACALVMVDFQARLMPAIADGAAVLVNARRLRDAAELLGVPAMFTEQSPAKLGPTVPELGPVVGALFKTAFDAGRDPGFGARLPGRGTVVVAGCEAHVCVLQTALGLLDRGRRVAVVEDAVGSRTPANKAAALRRLAAHGVEIVTTEMAVFEWLGDATHPAFRDAMALVK